ncbi:putative hydrolase or acyltransferase (alpha/beta hydrolase superfamily) [Rubidibacter lacunae KORDI 51-2]|uniref:Putative hydrolase or acyltransferase (Alpha/beta hydrolase superfamily) n=1 Tax=Rubidibacter lacunae KORDI 51-2 TaxID=582515 RepID=U5DFA0_9CHRO|nr:alpha/beta hydrolase [Rubidibacter lacunae]ERN43168.1 putative hydrolase or acyltransferase (alpha/beta hydrolase superfamily) [Rubidibacter lacunae KORDI 51-2]
MSSGLRSGATVVVRGVEHYYEWIRQPSDRVKPTLVFVHGWGGSSRYWRSTAQMLSAEYDCLLYDLRGFGRSRLPETARLDLGYELETYAEDLALLLDALGVERATINAHSMGASIAVLFLNRYSDRVEQAVLTCSGVFEYNPLTFGAFHWAGSYVVKLRFGWYLRVPLLDRAFMARFLHRPIPAEERQAFLEDFLLADPAAAAGTIYTAVSKQQADIMPGEFAQLPVPTLLIAGEKDIIIPTRLGRKAADMGDRIEYCEIPQAGHFPMLEDAPTYLAKVREFLGLSAPAVAQS